MEKNMKTQLEQDTESPTRITQKEPLLHGGFLKNAAVYGDKIAIISHNQSFTYKETAQVANQIAHHLHSLSAQSNELIAIIMHKGWEQVIGSLGVLIAGAAYLPIDPDLPEERIEIILQLGKVGTVLTQQCYYDKLLRIPHIQALPANRIITVNANHLTYTSTSTKPVNGKQTPNDIAYVIFTSGSTGTPKGVAIEHQAVMNTILDINHRFDVNSEDALFALSSLSFDLSVYDIFGTLTAGGTIIIPDRDKQKDPYHWLELILKYKITIWNTVPMFMQMLIEFIQIMDRKTEIANNQWMKLIMLSGDWIPLNLPEEIYQIFTSCKLVSLGGATEASIWSIAYEIGHLEKFSKRIPYGYSLKNQSIHVLDSSLHTCPVGAVGDIYIGGIGLARGYLENPIQTKAQFIHHPFLGKLYKTGDLGKILPSGAIDFLGRKDSQVKWKGHRIELGEIEATLNRHTEIKQSIVLVKKNRKKQNTGLVACIVPNLERIPNKEAFFVKLKKHAQKYLPSYMIPSEYIILKKFPINKNGKVNKLNLTKLISK